MTSHHWSPSTITTILLFGGILFSLESTTAVEHRLSIQTNNYRRTEQLGGADFPSVEECVAMHEASYVLRASEGKITKVTAKKIRLPFDAKFHPQGGLLYHAHDTLIYARQATILSKSIDGGHTWTSWNIEPTPKGVSEHWQVLQDGTFVRVSMTIGEGKTKPAEVYHSENEGRSWQRTGEISIVVPGGYQSRYAHWRMTKLPDETLFYCIDLRTNAPSPDRFLTAKTVLTGYRSIDGGKNWEGPIKVSESVAEGGFAQLPSGRLLASVRFQRPFLPTDSPAVRALSPQRNGFKNHFLLDSDDGGQTWKNLRPLTTVFGQCYGYPVSQTDGTVVVVHDTRYGPGPDAARGMISYDEGQTWENEVYYLFFEKGATSYSQSVVLADDTILTLGGTSSDPQAKQFPHGAIGNSHLTAIRWKPIKPERQNTTTLSPRSPAQAARRKALTRRRRIIFNDDTYELNREDANTPEGILQHRLRPLVGTNVDTISWSVLGGWADAPTYDSKVQPIYGDAHGGPPKPWAAQAKNIKDLIRAGTCPLRITIDFAHENGMEFFASIRMNDCHDSFLPGGVTLWKKEHPEFLVDAKHIPHDKDAHPKGLYFLAQDFTHAEVRDRKFEIIEEVCQRYDIDGIDLNYIRHPVFFTRTMHGIPVTLDEIEIMNNLMRRIRQLTDEVGQQRGRPILIASIVPDNLQLAKNVGLDVATWIREDLIDIVIPGLGYAPLSLPVGQFVDLARPYGVQVYPCINRKAPLKVSESLVSEGFRGIASNWFRDGADGLFLWNLGTPFEYKTGDELATIRNRYYAALPHLGDPDEMLYRDKLHGTDGPVLSYYYHITSTPTLPLNLPPKKTVWVDFKVADNIQAASLAGKLESLILTVGFDRPIEPDQLRLQFGSTVLENVELAMNDILKSRLTPDLVKQGVNRFAVSFVTQDAAAEEKPLNLTEVRLQIHYKK